MLNILFAIENEDKLERFSEVFKSDSDFSYSFFNDGFDAIDFAKEGTIDIAVISLELSSVDAIELSSVIFDQNTSCRFVFSFSSENYETAIELFNTYDESQLMEVENCEPDKLKLIMPDLITAIEGEYKLKTGVGLLKDKEKSYKIKIDQMNAILNSRLNCYKDTVKLFNKESAMLFDEKLDPDTEDVISFLEEVSIKGVELFFDKNIDFDVFYDDLIKKYSDPDNRRLFSLSRCEINDYTANSFVAFVIMLICESYYHYLKAYRGKVECSLTASCIKIDILYDIRAGHFEEKSWNYINRVNKNIINSIAEKCESAIKDGVIQYRIYFKKEYI